MDTLDEDDEVVQQFEVAVDKVCCLHSSYYLTGQLSQRKGMRDGQADSRLGDGLNHSLNINKLTLP